MVESWERLERIERDTGPARRRTAAGIDDDILALAGQGTLLSL